MDRITRFLILAGVVMLTNPPRSVTGQASALAPAEESERSSINVMSYNTYRGGTMRGQPLSQTAKVIREAKAEVVGVQETRSPSGVNGEELAKLLGWNHYVDRRNKSILTRHEIVERHSGGIKIELPSSQEASVISLHLPSNPHQPSQLLSIRGHYQCTRGPRQGNLSASPYPSDHRAVVATFTLPHQPKPGKLGEVT